jgi:vancomycin permeability regulator SanA
VKSHRISHIALVAARGVALFFGLFSLANAVGAAVGGRSENVWWIDLSFLPGPLPWAAGLIAAVVFVEYAFKPVMDFARRQLTAGVAAALSVVSAFNAWTFFRVRESGAIETAAAIPFSLLLAVAFAGVGFAAWRGEPDEDSVSLRLAVAGVAVLIACAFPLAQIAFFGTTDYRRPADVVVVPGARVYPDGRLSASLADRVDTAIELYREGLVNRIVMSGGIGSNGVDEAMAMRDHAAFRGVPGEAIVMDSGGVDTDSTVRNTVAMVPPGDSILVVSQPYHLPRLKLAFRAQGRNVYTVPAREARPIAKTPLFVAREIPGFWVYWARALLRDLRG